MLKIYLETSLIYFIVYMATGILFKKELITAINKQCEELGWFDEIKIYNS